MAKLEIRDVERPVCRWAARNGWFVMKLGSTGRRGLPDRLFVRYPNIHVYIEFKAPGRKPTKLQQYTHDQLRKLGAAVHVIDDPDEGKRVLTAAADVGA